MVRFAGALFGEAHVWPFAPRGEPNRNFCERIWRLNLKFFQYACPLRGNTVFGVVQFPGDTFVCSALGEPPQEPLLSRGQQEIEPVNAVRLRLI
jgi:hypothetical protein